MVEILIEIDRGLTSAFFNRGDDGLLMRVS